MIFSTSKFINFSKQLLIGSNWHKLNFWVLSLMWIPPLEKSIWLKDDKKKKSKEARDTTNAYLASACCPMLCSWNWSPLVSSLQSGKCPQNESLAWKFHFYTASQTFLLQRKQVQKTDREVVQQRSSQAQVFADHASMQLVIYAIVSGVSFCPSPEASYSLRRVWQNLSRVTITWDNGLWWVMTDVHPAQRANI